MRFVQKCFSRPFTFTCSLRLTIILVKKRDTKNSRFLCVLYIFQNVQNAQKRSIFGLTKIRGVQLPNDEITQITLNIDTNLIKNGSN